MSKNHVKQPIPDPKQPLPQAQTHPAGTRGVTSEQVSKMFDTPAVMVNNFQILPSESYIRMAFAEHDTQGVSHIRGVVAFDYGTLMIMGRMIETVLKQYVMTHSKEVTEPKTEEKAVAESGPVEVPANSNGESEKQNEKTPSNNS